MKCGGLFMNFVQILSTCDEIGPLLSIVKWVLNMICYAVPILLIIFVTIDVAKVVTAGNLDDKMKKEVGNKLVTRLIYAVVIFLVPTIISVIFNMLPKGAINNGGNAYDASWYECWRDA